MTVDVREIANLGPDERRAFFERDAGIEAVRSDVARILERVREEGDAAIRRYSEEFDDVTLGNFDVTDRCEQAWDDLDGEVRSAIETAIENVRAFHEAQRPTDWRREFTPGRELGRRFRPLDRVGVYVPGGTAAYPSSAVMGIVPATVAGVDHVTVVTPPADEPSPATLGAIYAAGADSVYSVGGAQAIGGLAYGTETLPRVQKIVGPGNRWVTAAKVAVRGDVEIDFPAGPSEILVVADETADPELVATELLAQAEHDGNASVVAVTDDQETAEAVAERTDERAGQYERESVIREALSGPASGVLLARSMSEAILFAESYAPEHLSIVADDDESILERIDSAGSVFLGPNTPVAAGDYASGTNHVLPTGGRARVTGGLSVETFMRSTTVQRLSKDSLAELGETIVTLAETEGLDAHAASVRTRLQ